MVMVRMPCGGGGCHKLRVYQIGAALRLTKSITKESDCERPAATPE